MTDSTGEDSPAPERETVPDSQDDVGGHCSTVDCVRPIVDDVLLPVVSDAQEPDVEREAAAAEEGYHDDDGAVWFEQGGEPEVVLRLPRDVPVPSKEMVRRHRAAGHCPYRSWCEDCVRGACNAPTHRASQRLREIPELHGDYGFFRDKKGEQVEHGDCAGDSRPEVCRNLRTCCAEERRRRRLCGEAILARRQEIWL